MIITRSGDPESPGQGPPRSLPTAQSLPGANCCAHSLSRTRLTLGMWGGLCSGFVEVEVKHSLPKASCSAHSLSMMMSWSWLIFDGCSVMLRGRFSRTNHCIGCTTQASLRQLWNNFETKLDNFTTILRQLWDNFGIALRQLWHYFEIRLGKLETTLGQFWDSLCTILENFGTTWLLLRDYCWIVPLSYG